MAEGRIVGHELLCGVHIQKAGRRTGSRGASVKRGAVGATKIVEAVLAEHAAHCVQDTLGVGELIDRLDELERAASDHIHRRPSDQALRDRRCPSLSYIELRMPLRGSQSGKKFQPGQCVSTLSSQAQSRLARHERHEVSRLGYAASLSRTSAAISKERSRAV